MTHRIPVGTPNTVAAKVIAINTGRTVFTGTLKECRSYKRNHYGVWDMIYLCDVVVATTNS